MKTTIIEDVISRGYQNHIQNAFEDKHFPWYFTPEISKPGTGDPNSGFSHTMYVAYTKPGEVNHKSPYFDVVLPILFEALGKYNRCCDLKELYRIRAGLFVRNQNNCETHEPHIDLPHTKHYTMIYYVKDSDGPTCIWDGDEIVERIDPVKGRCVLFPGETYHASSGPKLNSDRMVLNFNFLL